MVRLLYIVSGCAFLAAFWVFAAWGRLRCGADVTRDWIRDLPSAVQLYKERSAEQWRAARERTPPLVAQAQALASYLAPPAQAATERSARASSPTRDIAATSSPRVVSVKFRLLGTSYYANRPEESMALITEPSAGDAERRWVEEGSALGHFVVQEIREGSIVLRNGEDVRELTIEHRTPRRNLVRDVHPASRKVSKADPDTIEPDPNATIKVGVRRR